MVGANCVACGTCETCDGTASTTPKLCTDVAKPFRDPADGVCKACPAKHTCTNKCDKVACATGKKIVGGKCVACGLCETCDGSATTKKKECTDAKKPFRDTDGVCKACPSGFTCTDKCTKTCAVTKKVVGGKCVDCGLCEKCDGTGTTTPDLCTKADEYKTADGKCAKCKKDHVCNKCTQTLKPVTCAPDKFVTPKCTACPTGYNCDGKIAVVDTSTTKAPVVKSTTAAVKKTDPTMSGAKTWSTAIPLFITAFVAIAF